MTKRRLLLLPVVVFLVLVNAAPAPGYGWHIVFRIRSGDITESSSLVLSTLHRGLVYTANDSGDDARVFVLDRRDGAVVGVTKLANVTAVDVEAMTQGGAGSLVVADIGDNRATRTSVAAYEIPQPSRGRHEVTPKVVTLRYPDGPHDAESAIFDARTGQLYVMTKELGGAHVYATPRHLFARAHAVLRKVAPITAVATDATWIAGTHRVIVRTYFDAVIYTFPGFRRVDGFVLPNQPQGESIAELPDRRQVWVGTEGLDQPVYAVALPQRDQPTAPTTSSTGSVPSDSTPGPPGTAEHRVDATRERAAKVAVLVAGGALGVALVFLGVAWVRHRRTG